MGAKLIKENNFYKLIKDNIVLVKKNINEPIDIHYSFGELSLKNCQAIELGYDLDEVILEEFPYDFDIPLFETLGITEKVHKNILIGMLQGTLQKGFQKALEILGDKKFSEEDMINCFKYARQSGLDETDVMQDTPKRYVQSLQQNEWNVEIITEPMNLDEIREQGKGFLNSNTNKTKLDEKGKLILKRK